jgi:hypothetical protein
MTTALGELPGTGTPSLADSQLARESSGKLAKLIGAMAKDLRLRV